MYNSIILGKDIQSCNYYFNQDISISITPWSSLMPFCSQSLPSTPPSPRQPRICSKIYTLGLSKLSYKLTHTVCCLLWLASSTYYSVSEISLCVYQSWFLFQCWVIIHYMVVSFTSWWPFRTWGGCFESSPPPTVKHIVLQPFHLQEKSGRFIAWGCGEQVFIRMKRPGWLS